jgi:hypothetical protein
MSYLDYKYARTSQDIPEEHYAILVFSSVHIPGDERSRTCPGHGYPAHNEQVCQYLVFESKEAWEKEIAERTLKQDKHFVPIVGRVPKVATSVNVNIG